MKKSVLTIAMLLLISIAQVFPQTGTIKGFVYDAATGQPIPLASISLVGTKTGVVSGQDGYFLFLHVPIGNQELRVSFLGFDDYLKKVTIRAERMEQLVINLKPHIYELKVATINADRLRMERMNSVSAHHLTQETMKRIPGLTGQSDLAEYLQVIPGIIFTGDRGGQFYIRGGEPVQNLVKIDGMTVISPFHSIGFASVFDTETISSVDVYTAGFGSAYGGRISSVIDVKTRVGNRREWKAKTSASTFGYGLLVEGPLKKMTEQDPSSVSVILSNKGSYIRQTAGPLYPYLDSTGIPFNYNDLFGKVSFVGRKGDQLDIIGMHFTDAADYSGLIRSTWENNAGGLRFLVSPGGSNLLFESTLHFSNYQGKFKESEERPRSTVYNSIEGRFKIYYNGPVFSFVWGTELNILHTLHAFAREGNLLKEDNYYSNELFTYIDSRIETRCFLIEPGLRLHYYADKSFFSPEPRLKVRYRINDLLNLNLATGLYSQNLVSTTSSQDVVNLFQGFYISPNSIQNTFKGVYINDKIQLAWHAVCGLSYFGPKNLKLSVEGYVKDYYRMINYNRNKMYDIIFNIKIPDNHPDYLTRNFIFEKGWAYGLDFMADWNTASWNLYMAYSLGYATREDEFMDYAPHFDRRHNINMVAGYNMGKRKDWQARAHWNLGSGFPFTQSYGLYESLITEYGRFSLDPSISGDLSVWYAPINGGRLPWYHRLDISLQKTWKLGKRQTLELNVSVMNLYNRQNVFYVDRITMKRVNQLPVLPTLGINWRF